LISHPISRLTTRARGVDFCSTLRIVEAMNWEVVGFFVGLVGVLLAIPPAIAFFRETGERKVRQKVLDALPKCASWFSGLDQSDIYMPNFFEQTILQHGSDLTGLYNKLDIPRKDINKTLRHLLKKHKIEVFIYKRQPSRSQFERLIGRQPDPENFFGRPLFVKGKLAPWMQPTQEQLDLLIKYLKEEN
jgi:hypothetical protein